MGLNLGEAVGDEENAIDQEAVGRAFDLEVTKESIGAEEGERFIENVIRF